MLRTLKIQNAALIEQAEIDFCAGLNVLSGETGAGKSVILDCIDFVLGAKADREMVRTGAKECSVCAEFTCDDHRVCAALEELDIPEDDTLIITRKLAADGRGSLKLNGCPVTVSMLRRVTAYLVDIHGQSEHFYLLKESNQLRLLDSVAGESVKLLKTELSAAISRRKETVAALEKLGGDEGERRRRLDILRFQIEEIQNNAPKEGEEERLTALLERYRNAEKIIGGLSDALGYLNADGGGADAVNGAHRLLGQLSRYGEIYGTLADRLESVSAELEDVAATIESCAEELDIDKDEAERAEERMDVIKALKKKYGTSAAEISEFLQRAQEEYALLSDSGERFEKLSEELVRTEDEIYGICVSLNKERMTAAEGFVRHVTEELKTLNIGSARFEIVFGEFSREDAARATGEGLGGVKYYFSANAGEPPKELGKIISGGELSRFMLAIKAQFSGDEGVGTYLFDEIDAGISGKTARVVAEKFCKIARRTQIIAVTHSAQIAAAADNSYLIEKEEENGKTRTLIRRIEGETRIREIARLVGDTDSTFAQKHAEELIESAVQYKKSLT